METPLYVQFLFLIGALALFSGLIIMITIGQEYSFYATFGITDFAIGLSLVVLSFALEEERNYKIKLSQERQEFE